MAINISLVGDGFNVEREVTLTQAGKIIAFIGSESDPSGSAVGATGNEALSLDLPAQSVKPKGTKSRSKKSSNVSTQLKVREEVSSIKLITPELEGYLNYHKLPTKGAKVMWILAFGGSNDLETLRPNEITYIAGKLRDRIEPGDINGLTVSAAKNGLIAKVDGANYTLLHKGDEYLRELVSADAAK